MARGDPSELADLLLALANRSVGGINAPQNYAKVGGVPAAIDTTATATAAAAAAATTTKNTTTTNNNKNNSRKNHAKLSPPLGPTPH